MMGTCRVRTDVFLHCLVPVSAVLPNLDSIEDLRQRCLDVARSDTETGHGAAQSISVASAVCVEQRCRYGVQPSS